VLQFLKDDYDESLASAAIPAFYGLASWALRFFHEAFIFSDCALRWAAVKVRFLPSAASGAAAATTARGFFGGRPRRLVEPCYASMARVSLSRSASDDLFSVHQNPS